MNKYRLLISVAETRIIDQFIFVEAKNESEACNKAEQGDYDLLEIVRDKLTDTEFINVEEIELVEGFEPEENE